MVVFTDDDGGPINYQNSSQSGEDALNSRSAGDGARDLEQPSRARYSVAQVKDSMWEALDSIVQSGATDQMRGYANEAMGKTKLTLGLATQSSHLTLTGLAQIVVGEFQKSIGEAKLAEDGKDIFPGL